MLGENRMLSGIGENKLHYEKESDIYKLRSAMICKNWNRHLIKYYTHPLLNEA